MLLKRESFYSIDISINVRQRYYNKFNFYSNEPFAIKRN